MTCIHAYRALDRNVSEQVIALIARNKTGFEATVMKILARVDGSLRHFSCLSTSRPSAWFGSLDRVVLLRDSEKSDLDAIAGPGMMVAEVLFLTTSPASDKTE